MADMVVVEDLIAGAEFGKTKDEETFIRVFNVSNVEGNPWEKLRTAATATGIPRIDERDKIHGYSRVKRITSRPADDHTTNAVVVTVEYGLKEWENSQIESGATVVEKDRNKDYREALLKLYHTGVTSNGSPGGGTQDVQDQPEVAVVKVQFPQATIRITRREAQNPLEKSISYTGKINSKPFFPTAAQPNDKHYWLCTGITGHSDDGGGEYVTAYEFQRNDDSWDPVVSWIDPATKEPPIDLPDQPENCVTPYKKIPEKFSIDVLKGCSLARVQIYKEIDFSALGLNFNR